MAADPVTTQPLLHRPQPLNEQRVCLQMDVTGLPDGSLLMALNENPLLRTDLSLVRSTDGGTSWTQLAVIEDA